MASSCNLFISRENNRYFFFRAGRSNILSDIPENPQPKVVIRWRRTRQNGFGKKCCAPNDKMENHLLPAKSTRFLCNSYCLLCVETKHFFYRFSLLYLYYIRIYFTIIYLFFFFPSHSYLL